MPRWFNWNFSIFYKLVLAFLLVITPLGYISLHFIESGKRSIEDELKNSLESRVGYYTNLLENEMARVTKLQRDQLFDRELHNLVYASTIFPDFERSQMLLRIQHNLELIAGTSTFVEKVSVFIPLLNRVIASDYYGELPREEYEVIVDSLDSDEAAPLALWNGLLLQSMAFPERRTGAAEEAEEGEPAFVLSIAFSKNRMKEALAQIADYESSGAFLYDDRMASVYVSQGSQAEEIAAGLPAAFGNGAAVGGGIQSVRLAGTSYLIASRSVPSIDARIVAYVAEKDAFGKLEAYRDWILQLALLSVIVVLFFSFWIYRVIHRPLSLLVRSFRRVEKGNLEQILQKSGHDEFGYLYKQYNNMIEKLGVLIHQVYEQKIRAQTSELKQLQSQINPHFLYNTYFILYRLAKIEDNESVARFSGYLGEYFQYISRHLGDEVPLEMEIKHTRTYAEIQNFRFDGRIEIHWGTLPEGVGGIRVPKLLLQPIIENAYKHGLENKLSGGKLSISFSHDAAAKELAVTVEDNGMALQESDLVPLRARLHPSGEDGEGTGLRNVHRRLQIMHGEQSGISLGISELGGLRVVLAIHYGEVEKGEKHA